VINNIAISCSSIVVLAPGGVPIDKHVVLSLPIPVALVGFGRKTRTKVIYDSAADRDRTRFYV
jgi:hypothetical protein